MSSQIDYLYFFLNGATLLSGVLGLWFTAIMPGIDRWSKRFFLGYYSFLVLCCLICLIQMFQVFFRFPLAAIRASVVLEPLLITLLLLLMTAYLLHCCGEDLLSSKLFRTEVGLWLLFCILLISPLHTLDIYYVTPDGQVDRGSLYWILLLPLIAIMLLNIRGAIQR